MRRQLPDHELLRESGRAAVCTFDRLSQPAEIIETRIWAGLQYRSSDVAAQSLGGGVADYGISPS
jgi:hypothetical protein